jgi:hypothetical protein
LDRKSVVPPVWKIPEIMPQSACDTKQNPCNLGQLRNSPPTGAPLSWPLYPSRRHLQPSLGRIRWRQCRVSLEGLCSRQRATHHDRFCTGVYSPVPLHVLPKSFVRIRHFGFMSNYQRSASFELCRRLLQMPPDLSSPETGSATSAQLCPTCQTPLTVVERLTAVQIAWRFLSKCYVDTS